MSASEQRQSGPTGRRGRTMTRVATDFNYGIRAGKTLNFPIVSLPLALFFRSYLHGRCNFNRTHSTPDPRVSLCHPCCTLISPFTLLSLFVTIPLPRDRFPLDSRKISTNVELRFAGVRRITNKTLAYFFSLHPPPPPPPRSFVTRRSRTTREW